MDDLREMAKYFFFWVIKDPVIDGTILLMILVAIGFATLSVRIWRRDRKNDVKVKSGMRASQIRPTPVVVPMPPMPPSSMIGNGPDRLTGNVTRIVFVPGRGKPEVDITSQVKSVSFGPEDNAPTQPIEVTPDGEASEGQHGPVPDQDWERARDDLKFIRQARRSGGSSYRARGSGQRRRSGRRNRGTD